MSDQDLTRMRESLPEVAQGSRAAPTETALSLDASGTLVLSSGPDTRGSGEVEATRILGPASPISQRAAPPDDFPGYTLVGRLGAGGMAVVYKARQEGLNRLVALKVILGGHRAGPRE